MTLSYISVCSGIEAASVAWHPLGFKPLWFSETEKFPSAVLAARWPGVINRGDMTAFKEWPDARPDILVGGTPCQSFSVAGLRRGLADPRGSLMLTYLAIAERYQPRWVCWENVPGVLSSNGGRDFGTFLGALEELGYGWAYRVVDAQYVRVDGFTRAVPQRRRRVFVVGHSGGAWQRAAAVLFERESLSGNPPPRREAGQGTSADVAPGLVASGRGVERTGESRGQDAVVAVGVPEVCGTLSDGAHHGGGLNGQDAYSGRIIPVAHALRAMGRAGSHPNAGGQVAVAHPYTLAIRGREGTYNLEYRQDGTANAILTPNGGRGGIGVGAIAGQWAVRRLTPRECERLQGFPDDYTLVEARGKPAADGPRYKALGNSMAVNCMRWIGWRLAMADLFG
jgi:DNA (cytosine-5)-methyltransferase 1